MSNSDHCENNNPDLNSNEVPFFARFLEGQNLEELSPEEMEAIGGSRGFQTRKYPSDNEEGNGLTKKFPSDDIAVTLKYPSDAEDGGGGGEIFVTQKYPSDGEDGGGGCP